MRYTHTSWIAFFSGEGKKLPAGSYSGKKEVDYNLFEECSAHDDFRFIRMVGSQGKYSQHRSIDLGHEQAEFVEMIPVTAY